MFLLVEVSRIMPGMGNAYLQCDVDIWIINGNAFQVIWNQNEYNVKYGDLYT